ncbi:MAG TPA: hypothetical protein VEC37_17270, partial [Bacillota bacterium]|nr:hypothetical protein [Bacillota bacterium]
LTEKVPTDYLAISGFKEGDTVTLTSGQQNVVLTIRKIEGDLLEVIPVGDKRVIAVFPAGSVIETVDSERYIKSFILNEVVMEETSCLLKVALLEPGDALIIISEGGLNRAIPCGIIREVKTDRIYLEDNELVFAGVQRVNSATEPEFPYLIDLRSNEYHDLTRSVPECRIKTIPKQNRLYFKTANLEDLDGQTYQPCRYCWRSST